jgi:hypothetical protein
MKQGIFSRIPIIAGLIYGLGTLFVFLPVQIADQYPIRVLINLIGITALGIPGVFLSQLADRIQPQSPPLPNASSPIVVIYPPEVWQYLLAIAAGIIIGVIAYVVTRFLVRRSRLVLAVISVLYILQFCCVTYFLWLYQDDAYLAPDNEIPPSVAFVCEQDFGSTSIQIINYTSFWPFFLQVTQDSGITWRDVGLFKGALFLRCEDFQSDHSNIWAYNRNTLIISNDGGSTWSVWNPVMVVPPILDFNWTYARIEFVDFETSTRGKMRLVPCDACSSIDGSLSLQTDNGGVDWYVVDYLESG